MSDEDGDGVGEGELAPPDRCVGADPPHVPTQKEREITRSSCTCRAEIGAHVVRWAEDAPVTASPVRINR